MKYDTEDFVNDLPPEFAAFMRHLKSLSYEVRPNYDYLRDLLQDLYRRLGGEENTPFDWERIPTRSTKRPRLNSAKCGDTQLMKGNSNPL